MTRFLCTGDWHVGSGLDYATDRLADQRQVIERIVDLALEHQPDAVLLAGDLWHYRRPSPAELLAVWEPLQRLRKESMCDILAIPGNHDVTTAGGPIALDLFTDFVDVHSAPGIWNRPYGSIVSLPWAPVSRLVAARGGGDRDTLHEEAAELLLAAARGLRAQIPSEQQAVLLLHWSISGASTPTGVMSDDFREVVLPSYELEALGFDYVIAGHIHKAQFLDDDRVRMFYVGSPAPVDFGEAHVPHGCYLLDTDGGMPPTFLPIESRPFVTIDLDLTTGNLDLDLANLPDVTDAVVRVRCRATEETARRLDPGEWRRELYAAGAHKVFSIQMDVVREQRARVAGVDETLTPIEALSEWVTANEIPQGQSEPLADLTYGYLSTVGA